MNSVDTFLSFFPKTDSQNRMVKCADDEMDLTRPDSLDHNVVTSWASLVCDEKEVPGRNSESHPARHVFFEFPQDS